MTREEFLTYVNEKLPHNERINTVTDEEWTVIEQVYNFHPAISDVVGKFQIADIYVDYGYCVIADMKPRADLMARKEREYKSLKADFEAKAKHLEEDMKLLSKGGNLS